LAVIIQRLKFLNNSILGDRYMLYIKYDEAVATVAEKLEKHGCPAETAKTVAAVAVDINRDGNQSHGIARIKRLILSFGSGICNPKAVPEREGGLGGFERWTGNHGIGIINALACTDRAIELAKLYGVSCIALHDTNHFFRAGTYGWRIAEAGMVGIVFTNTKSNMVYHGTLDRILGTTPLVLAIPRDKGPVVADVSLGLYSYGKLQIAQLAGEQMATCAGYDKNGNLSADPGAVMPEARLLPLGEYKGSAINLLLDLIASTMSLGNSACDIRERVPGDENSISQIFMAINSRAVNSPGEEAGIAERLIEHLLTAHPAEGFGKPRYPGQNVLAERNENMKRGIPVAEQIWNDILGL
jgi:3-dehydro-L-gulonate 2-dehydrogenase